MRGYQFSVLCAGAQLGAKKRMRNQKFPVDFGTAKEATVHEESVCTVRRSSPAGFFTSQLTTEMEVPFDQNVWNKCRAMQKCRLFSGDCWRNEVIEGSKKEILYATLLSNGTVLHFETTKVRNSSFVVKVTAHFRLAVLPTVAVLTNVSNCISNLKEPHSISDR